MTAVLGISAFFHDAAAALLVDGRVVAAAEEERFTRKKHDPGFPHGAIAYCLREAGLSPDQIDFVGFHDKPLQKLDRLLESYLAYCPRGYRSFARAIPAWTKQKLLLPSQLRKALAGAYRKRVVFLRHHESHAASAFFPSPFEHAAIVTMDGVGEWTCASVGVGSGSTVRLLREQRFPHSVGLFYSAFTYFAGFAVNSGEYKLMGLAPYGQPRFRQLLLDHVIRVHEDGSVRLDLQYFAFAYGLRMTSSRLDALLGGPPRAPDAPITQRELDIAASVQSITDEIVLRTARFAHATTGEERLCMAGGVALNCVSNGKLLEHGPFERVFVQPAAGDSGGALGAATFIWHGLLGRPRCESAQDAAGSWLGPRFGDAEVTAAIERAGCVYTRHEDDASLCAEVAQWLAQGRVVGWFQDRMELGPRALGARSILGDPRRPEMKSVLNQRVKRRESFRPFAPAVLSHRAHEVFEVPAGFDSPYMTFVAKVARGDLPAITHVDGSARLQTVDARRHGRFHRLLQSFEALTGCPVLINTSFNVRGEPIVCTPDDAIRCFRATELDVLVLERCVLHKDAQPPWSEAERQAHRAALSPD